MIGKREFLVRLNPDSLNAMLVNMVRSMRYEGMLRTTEQLYDEHISHLTIISIDDTFIKNILVRKRPI